MMTIYSDTLHWWGITPVFDPITDLDLITDFDLLPNCDRVPSNICNGCDMPTEDAYSSGHLVLSHFGTCKCSNADTYLSWTCLDSGLLCFEHPSVLLFSALLYFVWIGITDDSVTRINFPKYTYGWSDDLSCSLERKIFKWCLHLKRIFFCVHKEKKKSSDTRLCQNPISQQKEYLKANRKSIINMATPLGLSHEKKKHLYKLFYIEL